MVMNDCYVIDLIGWIFLVLCYMERCKEHLCLILDPYNKIILLVTFIGLSYNIQYMYKYKYCFFILLYFNIFSL